MSVARIRVYVLFLAIVWGWGGGKVMESIVAYSVPLCGSGE